MDFHDIPTGFGMTLAKNEPAMKSYAALPENKKLAILKQAHEVRSKQEMHALVERIAKHGD